MARRLRSVSASPVGRITLANLLLVAGALVILTPIALFLYEEVMWRLEVQSFTQAPTPLVLPQDDPVRDAHPAVPPETGPEPTETGPVQPAGGTGEPPQSTPGDAPGGEPAPLKIDRSLPPPVYQLEIPRLELRFLVGEGIDNAVLARGPGRYPQTVLPGEQGNAAIAGHRTVRGRPAFFYAIDLLEAGDALVVGYTDKRLEFQVEQVYLTTPYDLTVLDPTPYPTLTLTTCDPPGSDERRLIVRARLVKVTPITE